MLIKSKRIIIRIFATFLILSLTLCFYTVSASAAQRYHQFNDTVYQSANAYGLEELPYGEDTGVIQFQYGTNKYITFYFDKLSIFDRYANNDMDIGENRMLGCLMDHYWICYFDENVNDKLDYRLSILSDSPIYYKISYDSGIDFNATKGTTVIYRVAYNGIENGSTTDAVGSQSYKVYQMKDIYLSTIVGAYDMPSGKSGRSVYSNVYQFCMDMDNGYYMPYPATGTSSNTYIGSQVGYNVEYYPSVEYLQNYDIRAQIVTTWKEIIELQDINKDILTELYSVNSYLEYMLTIQDSINTWVGNTYDLLNEKLPLIESTLGQILAKLEEIKTGPEYDSSEGIGSNTEFGDAANGLMQDTDVPDMGTGNIESNLGSSFLFIRNMFDWLTGSFNLTYIISFLLGLSFIAYVLGRVIKNKMNNS